MARNPVGHGGSELDALYHIEPSAGGFDLVIESRGGSENGPNSRNRDYSAALEQHLTRMGTLEMAIEEVQVASTVAMKLREARRRVSLDRFILPLAVSEATDVRELRLSIGRASAAFGRTDGSDRGNRTKRMWLRVRWPHAMEMTTDEIEEFFSLPPYGAADELPTDDPDELTRRVRKAAARIRTLAAHDAVAPPTGEQNPHRVAATVLRYVRDSDVVAWVLHESGGSCEICHNPAPFLRADGEPYLEVHHMRPLGEGGPDTVENAVACCPNGHRRLHHDAGRDSIRREAIASIDRLLDYPFRADPDVSGA